ncbi:MAG: type IV pilin [Thermoplasmata archaeon]|nr:MAG: type IV pilin [Thermoplasmata archaeon]KAA0015092.1 MAG: type IV pilin [Thermoplasmata archaeon]
MKANRKFVEREEAVSAVIGVILMVAITVAIAAAVYVYVSGMISGTTKHTPTISAIVDHSTNTITITGAEAGTDWKDIELIATRTSGSGTFSKIYVNSTSTGVTNPLNNGHVDVSNNQTTLESVSSSSQIVNAGDYIQIVGTGGTLNVEVKLVYKPTNTLIGSWTVQV